MTLSGAAADKRLAMSTANQKQALVHIYNIVTGSSVAVSLDQI
jgi:molybdopterin-containing oxidoreductase family iron-sulfur binding subunit